MNRETRSYRLYGTDEAPPPHRVLAAGPLTAWLEDGNLRYVTFAGHEVLRAISYVVRDRDWGTYRPPLTEMRIEEGADRFRLAYRGACRQDGATLSFEASIAGEASGRLSFVVEATADGPFETNRCGFTILHPAGVAGEPVSVEHADGSVEDTVFPALIDPWQPFMAIRALTHRPDGAFRAECRLEGDVFEMEDQRNWSDASFKTYVRPLALPWPYRIEPGVPNRQSVTLIIGPAPAGQDRTVPAEPKAGIELGARAAHAMPPVGVVIAPEEVDAAVTHAGSFGRLAPQAVLCHYDPSVGHGGEALAAFARLQKACPAEYHLECVVVGDDLEREFTGLARAVDQAGLALSSIAVCPSVDRQSTPPGSQWPACPPLEEIYRAARAAFPKMVVGGGMFSYFTELNRKRPPLDPIDFVTHATNPIVHAADDRSVMETLETLPAITRSVRAIIGADKPYRIGPSTIGMRQNPYGSRTMPNPRRERICMTADDPRQDGLFAAAWMIGYAAAVAPAELALLVPAAFTGPRGLVDAEGRERPIFRSAQWLAELAGYAAIDIRSTPRHLAALAATAGARRVLLVANLSDQAATFALSGIGRDGELTILDADGERRGSWRPGRDLTLDAFAIVRLEWN